MALLVRRTVRRLVAAGARLTLRILGTLPEGAGVQIGAGLGLLFGLLSPRRAAVARTNLRIAFPEWSEDARRRVMWRSFANLGRGAAEVAQLRRLPLEAVRRRTRVEGLEHLAEARRRSPTGGVIVITGHFGNWELLATAMAARGLPVTLVYRPRDNPHVEAIIRDWRERCGLEVVARGSAARAVLRALRAGRIAALPIDQNSTRREGVFVPFFHRLACTRDGPARIAMRTGAPVIPVFIFRVPGERRHVVRVGAPLEMRDAGEDRAATIRGNVRRMNEAVEAAIRAAPADWSWVHRRWKTQPRGEPRTYRSKHHPGPLRSRLRGSGPDRILTI